MSRRDGRNLFYSPDFERMSSLLAFLTDNCCTLADDASGNVCQSIETSKRKRA